ncbi:MAG: hypothetical protein AAF639_35255 [Chloroflexota bacterium]
MISVIQRTTYLMTLLALLLLLAACAPIQPVSVESDVASESSAEAYTDDDTTEAQTDETLSDETSSDETLSDETLSDETSSDAVMSDGPTVTIRNAFQAAMTNGNEMVVDEATATIGDDVEYDGIIFDIDVSAESISMVFNVSERAQIDPTGIVGADTFERYHISFEGLTVVSASASEDATVVPTVELVDGEILVEFSEGMELGVGFDALITIVTE